MNFRDFLTEAGKDDELDFLFKQLKSYKPTWGEGDAGEPSVDIAIKKEYLDAAEEVLDLIKKIYKRSLDHDKVLGDIRRGEMFKFKGTTRKIAVQIDGDLPKKGFSTIMFF